MVCHHNSGCSAMRTCPAAISVYSPPGIADASSREFAGSTKEVLRGVHDQRRHGDSRQIVGDIDGFGEHALRNGAAGNGRRGLLDQAVGDIGGQVVDEGRAVPPAPWVSVGRIARFTMNDLDRQENWGNSEQSPSPAATKIDRRLFAGAVPQRSARGSGRGCFLTTQVRRCHGYSHYRSVRLRDRQHDRHAVHSVSRGVRGGPPPRTGRRA